MTRMSQSLPDSGGAYFDVDEGGFVGVVRRNVGSAVSTVTSGDAGGRAVAVAIGVAAVPAGAYLVDKFGVR